MRYAKRGRSRVVPLDDDALASAEVARRDRVEGPARGTGGVAERAFLEDLSAQIGQFQLPTMSVSHGCGGTSHNAAVRPEAILDVADLAALPKGRAVVLASGARATLVRRVAWMDSRHADAVRASIRAHDPGAEDTIATINDATGDGAAAA